MRTQQMRVQAMRGEFTWRPQSDVTKQALTSCAEDQPFKIASHNPGRNKRDVSFLEPDLRIQFTHRYRPQTITDQNVQLGFLDENGLFQQVAGELVLDDDQRTVWFAPEEELHSMVFYRVRVKGGPGGVLSENGDELPDSQYEWRFGTAPRLAPGARGVG